MNDKMSKEDMLGKIEELEANAAELRAMVEEIDKKPEKLTMVVAESYGSPHARINGKIVISLNNTEGNDATAKGAKASGRGCMAHLHSDSDGQWFGADGNKIGEGLYYKPATD